VSRTANEAISQAAAHGIDLILITGDGTAAQIEQATGQALRAEPPSRLAVQLRSRQLPSASREALGHRLRALTRARGARLLVNQDLELALRLDADGLQLPEGSPAAHQLRARCGKRLIGVSTHDAHGLEAAAEGGADFALLSPVHAVEGKNPALGPARFAELVRRARLPVFALGGVDAHNAAELVAGGAAGLAVIRAVYAASDPAGAVQTLLAAIEQGRANQPGRELDSASASREP
jgi:thiamine-phosphate pyrophosphorylase